VQDKVGYSAGLAAVQDKATVQDKAFAVWNRCCLEQAKQVISFQYK
jgi:hypothetical protein